MNGPQQIKECRERMASYTPEQREELLELLRQYVVEDRQPIPAFEPTILFDEETVNNIDWKQFYPF